MIIIDNEFVKFEDGSIVYVEDIVHLSPPSHFVSSSSLRTNIALGVGVNIFPEITLEDFEKLVEFWMTKKKNKEVL